VRDLLEQLRALFRPTPPPTDEEVKRLAEIRPATDDEIDAARDKFGWRRLWPL